MTNKQVVGVFIFVLLVAGALILYFSVHNAQPINDVLQVPLQNSTTTNDLPIIDPSESGQPTYTNATSDQIQVTLPFPGAVTGKDFSVRGKARGPWFFEASFPVLLFDKNGTEIAQGIAQVDPAGTNWMTTDFVPFKADMVVPKNFIGPATLVLMKDNPSGIPEKDASVSFPITVEY